MIQFNNVPKWLPGTMVSTNLWLQTICEERDCMIANLVYNFVDDKDILRINQDHLQHDYTTDIITFQYGKVPRISGEVFISVDTVKDNAVYMGVAREEELVRVMAHGLLHLIGFNDGTEEEKGVMRLEEEKCLFLHAKILKNK